MRVSSKNILFLALAAYIVNAYYAWVPGYALGLWSLGGGIVLLQVQCGWRESLAFALCYGTFLAILSATLVIGWVVSLANGCAWLLRPQLLLGDAVPHHGGAGTAAPRNM